MNCPACDGPTRTLETRAADGGAALRRRRECRRCGERYTTFERRAPEALIVIKRGGRRQPFDRAKLRAGLVRASHKRDVDPRALEAIADGVEREAHNAGGEITAERIGELCLAGLEPLDRGAFLQFAGTLPDAAVADSAQKRESGGHGSIRAGEDAAELPPKTDGKQARGEF
jgi:transcriptional repressor NrdR